MRDLARNRAIKPMPPIHCYPKDLTIILYMYLQSLFYSHYYYDNHHRVCFRNMSMTFLDVCMNACGND